MMTNQRLCWPSLMAAATLLFGAVCAQAQEEREIGTTSAVNPQATGFPPVSPERELVIGTDVVTDERVVTTADGQAQMLFLDGSALTIGPNSQVTLDKFVYDPDTKTGELAFSATKGLFRLVGGRISKTTQVVFKTPTATIGIRGGIVIIDQQEAGPLDATYLFGEEATVSNEEGTQTIRRPGFTVSVEGPDAAPSAPVLATAELLNAALRGLEGRAGATGGAAEAPTGATVEAAAAEVVDTGSDVAPEEQTTADEVLTAAVDEVDEVVAIVENPDTAGVATVGDSAPDVVGTSSPETAGASAIAGSGSSDLIASGAISGGAIIVSAPLTFSGGYFSDPRIINYDDVVNFTGDLNPLRNFTFIDGQISNGRLTATLGSSINVPALLGLFSFGAAGTNSPFGPVSGTGFVSSDLEFFAYSLQEADAANNPAFIMGGVPTPQANIPTSGFAAHDILFSAFAFQLSQSGFGIDPGTSGTIQIPFLTPSSGGDIPNAVVSPVLSAYHPNLFTFPDDGRSVALQASLAIDGQGASQQSVLSIGTLFYFEDIDTNTIILSGPRRSMSRLSGTSRLVRTSSDVSTIQDGSGNAFFGSAAPNYFAFNSDFHDSAQVRIHALAFEQPHNLFSTTQPSNFSNFDQTAVAAVTTPPAGLGATRTAHTMNGYAAGIMESRAFPNGPFTDFVFGNANDLAPLDVSIQTEPSTNRILASFRTRDVGSSSTADDLIVTFGSLTGPGRAGTAYVDDDHFAARENPFTQATLGGASGFTRGALVNQHVVPATNFLPSGVSFCECQFLQWGYWLLDFIPNSGPEAGRRDRTHLATWVVGELPDLVDIPSSGSASYSGHLIGNVKNAGAFYIAAGNYTQTWNFGAMSGSVSITNFDGVNFSGSASSANGREFGGSFSGGGRSGFVEGSFFAGGGDPVAELGGFFDISGANYIAAGTFAAAKQP